MASRPIQILIVATHPADSFDMAGGTLSHHAAQGDKVTAVIATTGVRSHHWELAEKKRLEGASLDVEKFVGRQPRKSWRKYATPVESWGTTTCAIWGLKMTTFL